VSRTAPPGSAAQLGDIGVGRHPFDPGLVLDARHEMSGLGVLAGDIDGHLVV
jgi:hypothetical protein